MDGFPRRIFLAFIVLSAVLHTTCGQCGFPSSWQYTWWYKNDIPNNKITYRIIELARETVKIQDLAASQRQDVISEIYQCTGNVPMAPYQYYVRKLTSGDQREECVQGYVSPNSVESRILIFRSVATGASDYPVSSCVARTDLSLPVGILVRYPFQFDVQLPFKGGDYQATVTTSTNQLQCDTDLYSVVTLRETRIGMGTCIKVNTYEQPYSGGYLQIAGLVSATFLESPTANGPAMIAQYQDTTSSMSRFYVIRYQIAPNDVIFMSIQGSSAGTLNANPDLKFDSHGASGSEFQMSFRLTPLSCATVSCENGGTCSDVSSKDYGFFCACSTGFAGKLCEKNIEDCPAGACSGNGQCIDMVNSYRCACNPGWIGTACNIRDYCVNNPCGANGQCTNTAASYQCACNPGFYGTTCDKAKPCYNKPCKNNGLCVENLTSNTYTCNCQGGFTGTTCERVLYCYNKPCMFGSCREGTNDYICDCQPGYTGKTCNQAIQCYNNPCVNGGTCRENANSYTCQCRPGFTGTNCQTVNYCYNHDCANGATCRESTNSYTCDCRPGYTGSRCNTVVHCAANPCRFDGTCVEQTNTYSCVCPPNRAGYNCETLVSCASSPCRNGATCRETGTTFVCDCRPGFSGIDCSIPPVCSTVPCKNGGSCVDTGPNTYICSCPPQWQGATCETPIVNGQCVNNPCMNGGTCYDRGATYVCGCKPGFSGAICEQNLCIPNPCKNNGNCLGETTSSTGYSCICTPGYTGPNCDKEGSCGSNPCKNDGQCSDNGDKYDCKCMDGWEGDHCERQKQGMDWTIILAIIIALLVLVFIILAILVCVCCVMRNQQDNKTTTATAAMPQPKSFITREVVLPPPRVQVVQVDKRPGGPMAGMPMTVAQPNGVQNNGIQTRAMFVTDNPQKIYNVNNPLDYQYPPLGSNQNIYSMPKKPVPVNNGGDVTYVGALEPVGIRAYDDEGLPISNSSSSNPSSAKIIDVSFNPDVDVNDYLSGSKAT